MTSLLLSCGQTYRRGFEVYRRTIPNERRLLIEKLVPNMRVQKYRVVIITDGRIMLELIGESVN
jgi:hypothetical protein